MPAQGIATGCAHWPDGRSEWHDLEPPRMRRHTVRRDEGVALHPRRSASGSDELIEHEITAVLALAGEPVPVPGGGISGEVTPLMVKPAPAADAAGPPSSTSVPRAARRGSE